ncbi:TRIM2_3 [Mytilus edulis]|uniref:TRIM2_3 n=1 Tax=Mytilus edulis TaxID=6550 RepID=A0A8S3SSP3_MYTED|nr:TRIM2_3 [Mytilus edulis]
MMSYNTKRQIPELLASLGNIGGSSHNLPLSHSICCKLCLGIFNHPKLLPCLHSFCLGCLQAYIHKSPDNIQERKLLCPICQESNTLPGTGLKGLLDNKVIEHSIASNVPTLSLRKKQEPLFPGLYSDSEDSYEILVKKANPKTDNEDDVYDEYSDTENIQWQNFIQRQKSADFETTDCDIKKPINISEALKGLSDEERLEN